MLYSFIQVEFTRRWALTWFSNWITYVYEGQLSAEKILLANNLVSSNGDEFFFTLHIKVYSVGAHTKLSDGNKMTKFITGMNVGDFSTVKGASGHLGHKREMLS